jgi:molybdopterin-guanine dinucleotide biosynthesis protein A
VGGARILDRVAAALQEVCDRLILVANHPEAASWLPGVPAFPDVLAGQGSLGGIHAALHYAAEAVLVVAWDMPFIPAALLSRLQALGNDCDAAVPESDSRRGVEPLCAWYAPTCLPAIEAAIRRGDRRVVSFFDAVRVSRLPAAEVAKLGDPSWIFMNVNSPDDLERANSYAATAGSTAAGHHRT